MAPSLQIWTLCGRMVMVCSSEGRVSPEPGLEASLSPCRDRG